LSTTESSDRPVGEITRPRAAPTARPPKRRRRGLVIGTAVVVLVLAGGGIYVAVAEPFKVEAATSTIDSGSLTGLTQVTKGNLSARVLQNGTLGYAGSYKVVDKASGTMTSQPSVSDVIRQGEVLYRVDGVPVVLLRGSTPAYRDLSWGTSGADVRQLNAALVALGYAKKSHLDATDDHFGRPTYYALRRLQDAVGLDVTGTLSLGEAVFLPAYEIRITAVNAVPGAAVAPNQSIITASSTTRLVDVSLPAGQQTTVAKGDSVTITLPNGKTTPGTVSSVGKVATKSDNGTTIDVLITPTRPADTGSLDQAPVQITITANTVKNVLSVPINALLSLAGGGYAVEVADAAGAHTLVAVKIGVFDDSAGRVEVSGDGLSAGQNVVVPAS
jgi:hypothetical protein